MKPTHHPPMRLHRIHAAIATLALAIAAGAFTAAPAAIAAAAPWCANVGHGQSRYEVPIGKIRFYEHINYGGAWRDWNIGDGDYSDNTMTNYDNGVRLPLNDQISSALNCVPNRCVLAHEHAYPNPGVGTLINHGEFVPDMRYTPEGNWNDQLSSHFISTQPC